MEGVFIKQSNVVKFSDCKTLKCNINSQIFQSIKSKLTVEMVKRTRASGRTANEMDSVLRLMRTKQNIKGNGKMIRNTEREFRRGPTVSLKSMLCDTLKVMRKFL